MTLLVLAAGMGSRYGGLKQLDPMTEHGEFIIDFSVYDAIRAGYTKVVFIIKEENYDIFRTTIGKRIEKVIDVEYVFQDMKVPDNIYFTILPHHVHSGSGYRKSSLCFFCVKVRNSVSIGYFTESV